jgi:hypothetical protein
VRLLFTIPHYFNPSGDRRHGSGRAAPETRAAALDACILALHRNFGRRQAMIDIARRQVLPANEGAAHDIDVLVHAQPEHHLLHRVSAAAGLFEARTVGETDPRLIGFACHETLRERLGGYDFYCYLEDDLVCRDPWHFAKLRWFAGLVGDGSLLQPNRFEAGVEGGRMRKVYVDGDLRPEVTAPFQSVEIDRRIRGQALGRTLLLERALNPHAGCFFLNAEQMKRWAEAPHFLDRDTRFIGPLESAATLGIMRSFKVYKPARNSANFFEIEHQDDAFSRLAGTLKGPPAT